MSPHKAARAHGAVTSPGQNVATSATESVSMTSTTAAPPAAPWTMDSAMTLLVTAFYIAVIVAAVFFFMHRWYRRTYGASSSSARSGAASREERAGLRGADNSGGEAGFIATIGAIIDRVMNRTALSGAAAWQDSNRHRNGSNSGPGHRHKPGADSGFLRSLAPYLPGAQSRGAAARRNKEKDGSPGMETVEVEVGGTGNAAGSPMARHLAASTPAPAGATVVGGGEGGSSVPTSGLPSTMTARDTTH